MGPLIGVQIVEIHHITLLAMGLILRTSIFIFFFDYMHDTMHLTSCSYIIMHTLLVRRPWVIRTLCRSFGEHSCTALARGLLTHAHLAAPSRSITQYYGKITSLELAKAGSQPVIISIILACSSRAKVHVHIILQQRVKRSWTKHKLLDCALCNLLDIPKLTYITKYNLHPVSSVMYQSTIQCPCYYTVNVFSLETVIIEQPT